MTCENLNAKQIRGMLEGALHDAYRHHDAHIEQAEEKGDWKAFNRHRRLVDRIGKEFSRRFGLSSDEVRRLHT